MEKRGMGLKSLNLIRWSNMFRILFVVFFLWFGSEVAGQSGTVPRSAEVAVIQGKSFYLHIVQPGQTLYAISKAYGVGMEELKKLNGKKDDSLSLYEVLKVPLVETFVRQDSKYYYHRVAKGETLYSIARHYGLKIKQLLRHNGQFAHNVPVHVGEVVRLPLKEINPAVLEPSGEGQAGGAVTDEKGAEASGKPLLPFDESGHEVGGAGQAEGHAADGTGGGMSGKAVPVSEAGRPGDAYVKVALLLPFSAGEYPLLTDSLLHRQPVSIPVRDEQFIHFYEGILLAVDSLKSRGSRIQLYVYDTERNPEKMYRLADELNLVRPDLIIGPVYASVFRVLAQRLAYRIPMVYPLSLRGEGLNVYPNFVQVNASYASLMAKMAEWIQERRQEANVVQIDLGRGEYGPPEASEIRHFSERMSELGIVSFHWNAVDFPLDSLRTFLLPDRENILLLPTSKEAEVSKVLPMISALTDSYRLTVVGLPEWQAFTSVDHETYYKLNTKFFTYSYVDPNSRQAGELMDEYRKYFSAEPHSLMFKAFDLGIYFIDLAERYRDRTLEAILDQPKNGEFSCFRFVRIGGGNGIENQGFYIVHFGTDYRLQLEYLP